MRSLVGMVSGIFLVEHTKSSLVALLS